MISRLASFALLGAAVLSIGCSSSQRSTLAPTSIAGLTQGAPSEAIASAHPEPMEPIEIAESDDASFVTTSGMMAASASSACKVKIAPGKVASHFKVIVTPCSATWKLEAGYLTKNGNWWNSSILVNQHGTMSSKVTQALGSTTVTVDLRKLPAASSAKDFKLTLTGAGTATFRFHYER